MALDFSIERRGLYAAVRVAGSPSLAQFISFARQIGIDSAAWPQRCALFDLRGITTLRAVTDHVEIGKAVIQHLHHLRKIASLVPPERITGISRRVAQEGGVNLAVFVDEADAVAWLLSD
jgi:hypothetical protein